MKFLDFLNESVETISLSKYKKSNLDFSVSNKYEKYQKGLIKSWGNLLYLGFDGLDQSSKCVPYSVYKETFEEYFDAEDEELEDLDDWISDSPPTMNGIPLYDKNRIESDFLKIAKSTRSTHDMIIFRVNGKNDWKNGWKSFTIDTKSYGLTSKNSNAFKILKGCPLIFAGTLADKYEIISDLTHPDIKNYVIQLKIDD